MNAWPLAFWIAAIVAVFASVALALLATRPNRHWLIAPTVVPILAALLFAFTGLPAAPHILLPIGTAFGFVLLGIIGGSPVVSLVLDLATTGAPTQLGTHGGILVKDAKSPSPTREILRGGATIGYVERLALIGCVLVGQAAGVAVLVAVKGLGRFSELENAAARERFIIGSLVSLVWAGACTTAIMISW
jgi:hypothetical protein